MAFDGITISCIVKELSDTLIGGRISKVTQPEADEIMLTIKPLNGENHKLILSASPSLPLVYLTDNNKPSPLQAPNFCMVLRKHIQGGRIIEVSQPDFERVINITVEHLDEMGDLCQKTLVTELMGKHSNIILLNDQNTIVDSIKHIPAFVSSVREVLPGKEYFIAKTTEKENPLVETEESFLKKVRSSSKPLFTFLYTTYTGLSPFYSHELCYEAGLDSDISCGEIDDYGLHNLFEVISAFAGKIKDGRYSPCIVYENNEPYEYSALPVSSFKEECIKPYSHISPLLEDYYAQKAQITRIRAKSADLRHIVTLAYERNIKKYDLQQKQLLDTQKKDTYKLYGELLNAYGYNIEEGVKSAKVINYYTNEEISVPLDPDLKPLENAQKYFEKYNKLKRTADALGKLTLEVKEEIDHLESVLNSLDIAICEDDLAAITQELILSGYIKRKSNVKPVKIKSKPFHYVTKEGFHIYVGKNNLQNEEITFNLASKTDWWFHAKKMPGSHVIVKANGEEIPDSVFEDAAKLAAYYSKAKGQSRIEVDYVQRKEVKHPNGSKPGFVVYYTNYSMLTDSDISHLKLIEE